MKILQFDSTQQSRLYPADRARAAVQGTLYDTDFPLSDMALTSAWYFPLNLTFAQMRSIASIANHWDRVVALKQALGVSTDVFSRSALLLGLAP